jgi:hypothetical protein
MLGLATVTMLAAGCSAADDESAGQGTLPGDTGASPEAADDLGAPATVGKEQVLAKLAVGGETYTFLRFGEGADAELGLLTEGQIGNQSVLQGLLENEGELTLLEIFQALAPNGTAPDALVQSHATEVNALGRSDSRVRLVEKTKPPTGLNVCDVSLSFWTPIVWTNKFLQGVASGGDAYMCLSNVDAGKFQSGGGQPNTNSCTFTTSLRRMLALCNNGNKAVTTYYASGTTGNWTTYASSSTAVNEYKRYDFAASDIKRRTAIVGLTSFGHGEGYGLRSATGQ